MKQENVYRKIIDNALAMPIRDPRPIPEPVPRRKKVAAALTTRINARRVALNAYNILIDAIANDPLMLAEEIPADKLHLQMAIEINRLSSEAIMRGGLPLSIHIYDRFQSFIDFGHGRTMRLFVQLVTRPQQASTANFIVEESGEFEEIDFNLTDKGEPRIISASITQVEK